MAQDHHGIGEDRSISVLLDERSAEGRGDAEPREQAWSDPGATEPDGNVESRERARGRRVTAHCRKRLAVLLQVRELIRCQTRAGRLTRLPAGVQHLDDSHEPFGVRKRQRPEDDAVYEAEDGSGGTNAERERQYGNGAESRIATEAAGSVPQIANDRFKHASIPGYVRSQAICHERYRLNRRNWRRRLFVGGTACPTFGTCGTRLTPSRQRDLPRLMLYKCTRERPFETSRQLPARRAAARSRQSRR